MDGLMINTEPIQSKAYETILKEYGKTPLIHRRKQMNLDHHNSHIEIPFLDLKASVIIL